MRKLLKEEAGSVAVLVALCFVMMVGLVAIVVDVGRMYIEYNQLVRAVDAAALAGALEMPRNPGNIEEVVREYAERNGVKPDQLSISVNGSNKEVAVKAARKVVFTFAPAIGLYETDVKAQAKARVGAINSVGGAVPLAVEKKNFVYGVRYVLKYGASRNFDGTEGDTYDAILGARSGWFGALALGGTGASNYEDKLKNGYSQVLQVGQILNTETGNVSGPTSDGVNFRLGRCNHTPKCSVASYNPACPSLVWLPVIVQVSTSNLTKQVRIVGFAAFLLEGVGGSGLNNYVTGHFVQEATSGEFGTGSDGFGLMAVKLVE